MISRYYMSVIFDALSISLPYLLILPLKIALILLSIIIIILSTSKIEQLIFFFFCSVVEDGKSCCGRLMTIAILKNMKRSRAYKYYLIRVINL